MSSILPNTAQLAAGKLDAALAQFVTFATQKLANINTILNATKNPDNSVVATADIVAAVSGARGAAIVAALAEAEAWVNALAPGTFPAPAVTPVSS